jgi:hypothetical protein
MRQASLPRAASAKRSRAPAGQPSQWRSKRANRNATPPGQRKLVWTPSKATSTTRLRKNMRRPVVVTTSTASSPRGLAGTACRPTSTRTSLLGTTGSTGTIAPAIKQEPSAPISSSHADRYSKFLRGSRCRIKRHKPTRSPQCTRSGACRDSAHPAENSEGVSKLTTRLDKRAALIEPITSSRRPRVGETPRLREEANVTARDSAAVVFHGVVFQSVHMHYHAVVLLTPTTQQLAVACGFRPVASVAVRSSSRLL